MVRLAKDTTTTQPAFNFLSKWRWDVLFLLLSLQLALVSLLLGTVSVNCLPCLSSKCRACDASCKCLMAVFFLFFQEFFMACFVVDLDILVEYAQSIWGFPFRGPPGSLLHSSCLHLSSWHSFDNDCCCRMIIIMILMRSSWRLCCICQHGCLVAPRLIAKALLIALEELFSGEHFCASQWWRWSCPWQLTMALIVPITNGNVLVACCCLLQLCLVSMLTLCSQLGLLIF